MEHPKNANQGAQTKWFVCIDLQYAKKKVFPQLIELFMGYKMSQNCRNQKLLLESESFWSTVLLTI
jgi:hypothetical protein